MPHDDHADRAVNAGLGLLRELSSLSDGLMAEFGSQVRVAVNSGRVVVGTVGSPNRLKYAVIGDPVNVAARLESIGEPNALTMGEETWRRLSAPGDCEDLGPIKLRGRVQPVRAYRIRPEFAPGG